MTGENNMNDNQLGSHILSAIKILGTVLAAHGYMTGATFLGLPGVPQELAGLLVAGIGLMISHLHHGIPPANGGQSGPSAAAKLPVFFMFCTVSAAVLLSSGCASQSKKTVQKEPYQVNVVQTDNGTVLYPTNYLVVTNGGGAVQAYPEYAAIVNTNAAQFCLKRFFWGGDHCLTAYLDNPYELHKGGGRSLFVDSQYSQLESDFDSGPRFGGTSKLAVGSITLTVNTNSITATGNAGNQLLQGLGSSVGNILANAKK